MNEVLVDRFVRSGLLTLIAASMLASSNGFCSAVSMNGPGLTIPRHEATSPVAEASIVKIVFLGVIDLYRSIVSPVSGSRCGFYPSCSTFGRQAVSEYGAVRGVMMTGDRLTRCNIFKEPGADYFLLPSGRLFDPVSANTLTGQGLIP